MTRRYKVADEFTEDLGHRFYSDGDYSGEQFRDEVLLPLARQAISRNEELLIDFDGVYGMPPSFIEEAFGGLRRRMPDNIQDINRLIKATAENSPKLWVWVNYANACLRESKPRRPGS